MRKQLQQGWCLKSEAPTLTPPLLLIVAEGLLDVRHEVSESAWTHKRDRYDNAGIALAVFKNSSPMVNSCSRVAM